MKKIENKTAKKKTIALTIQAVLFGGAAAMPALADDAQTTDNPEKQSVAVVSLVEKKPVTEKITVTGSRLRRDSFSVSTPLVTLSKDAIADTGLGSLAEILIDHMPAISAGVSNSTSQSSVSTTGLSTIDLRDLGTNRTLTLIDGRRVVSNSYSGNSVSLSTIPSGMVERVEVISGGASATYGADAVAGVVNIITQSDKEGFSFKSRTGETTDGGGKEFTFDVNYGTDFDDSRGYLYFSSTWDRQFGMSFDDRKRAQVEDSYQYNDELMCNQMRTATGFQCMRDITQDDWRSKSDGTLGGVFLESSRNDTQFWYDGQTLRDDWKDNEEIYGINSQQYVMLKVPNDNFTSAIKFDYELSDDVTLYAQVQYSDNGAVNNKSPEDDYESAYVPRFDPVTGDPLADVRPGFIPIDNPYVPQEIIDSNPYKDRIYWDRRFAEVGNISTDNERKTIRSWTGLQGTAFNGEWDWDASVSYGQFKQKQLRYNELNVINVAQALQAEQLEDGTIQCIDADARAAGCVPLNLFGEGSITPEMADWIRTNPTLETKIQQYNVVGYMTGDLFELPAGAVSAVFGAEYRKDVQDLQTSEDMKTGGITWNVVPAFKGDVDVYEAFAEFAIPLLKDAPLAKSLSAETSLRVAKYSMESIDVVSSYKFGLVWQPIEGYMVRANYARAQRAPTITELMSPPRGDFDTYDDICDGVSATSTQAGHDKCRLEPTIAALIAEDGSFVFEDENNGYSPNTGNGDLKEETADTYTFGITMAPAFLPNFRLAIDYYDIAIEDAISEISNEDIIKECYNSSAAWGDSNRFCNDITRDEEGYIIKVLQRNFNLDELTARGVDIAAEYLYSLGEYGQLAVKADMTHVIENSRTYQGNDGLEVEQFAGFDSSKDKASVSLAWTHDDLRVRWSTKYIGSFVDSQNRAEDYQAAVEANNERCAAADEMCVSNPETLRFHHFGSYFKHDLSVSYLMNVMEQSELRLFAGVNNVFDDKGAFSPGGRGNFESQYGGGEGRFVYLGGEFSW